MLKVLTYIQILFLFIQLIFSWYDEEYDLYICISFLIYFIYLLTQLYYFKDFNFNFKITSYLWYWPILFCFIVLYIYTSSSLLLLTEKRTILNALQDVPNIGLLYKTGGIIIPAIAISYFVSNRNPKLSYLLVVLALLLALLLSYITLSKQPLIPFILFVIWLMMYKKISLAWLGILIFPLFYILVDTYVARNSAANIGEIIKLVVTRIVMLSEFAECIRYIISYGVLNIDSTGDITKHVTELVFERNSKYIGLAPSYLGVFILYFGVFGVLIANIFTRLLSIGLKLIKSQDFIGLVLFNIWVLEFISFFTDGIPHFYSSTTDGIFFWSLLMLSVFKIILYDK